MVVRWPWRRTLELELSAEDYAILASSAADCEEWGRALGFIQHAKRLAPTSARLSLDEGYFLQELGRLDEAAAAYQVASELTSAGDAQFLLGLLLARLGRADDAALAIIEAMRRSPEVALDVEEEPDLGGLARDPRVRRARSLALARLDSRKGAF